MSGNGPIDGDLPLFDQLPLPGGDPAIAFDTFGTPRPVHAGELEHAIGMHYDVRAEAKASGRTIAVRFPGEQDISDILFADPSLVTLVERVGEDVNREIPVRKAYLTQY